MQNNSGEAVDQIIRITTEAGEVGLRLTGTAAKEFTLLIASLLRRDQGKRPKHNLGRQRLMKFLRACHGSGSATQRFTFETPEKFKAFEREADKYKLNFTAVRDKQDKTVTVLFREDDTRYVNDILHSLGYDKMEPGNSDLSISPVDPAELARDAPERTSPDAPVADAKKNRAPGRASTPPERGWKEWQPPTADTTAKTDHIFGTEIIDVRFYEVPSLSARPERMALPVPEHYIAPHERTPDVIYTQSVDGQVQDIKRTKPSVRDKIYSIRAERAKQQSLAPQKTRTKKPRAKVR